MSQMNTELNLFDQEVMDSLVITTRRIVEAEQPGSLGILNHKLCELLSFTGKYEMPVVDRNYCKPPKRIAAFYRLKDSTVFTDCVPHFYTTDQRFESMWSNPYKDLVKLLRFRRTITTDFSVYHELVYAQKVWNIFRNKLLAAWWQLYGITPIPNVSWLYGFDPDISFDGWPRNSLIAVNTTGIGRDEHCKRMWLVGYEEMLRRLQPSHILRYGAKIAGECEEISTYYPNDNFIFARYGRK